jgi:low affinity Fe/Cu permease
MRSSDNPSQTNFSDHNGSDHKLDERRNSQLTLPEHSGTANGSFHTFAGRASLLVGSKWAFTTAVLIIVFWALCGPYFHFSDTWQLVVNTATTIVTFLIVFLIQNTQNRDARAIHLKLDEIIHAIKGARNEMIQIENLSDADLEAISKNFERIRAECARRSAKETAHASK